MRINIFFEEEKLINLFDWLYQNTWYNDITHTIYVLKKQVNIRGKVIEKTSQCISFSSYLIVNFDTEITQYFSKYFESYYGKKESFDTIYLGSNKIKLGEYKIEMSKVEFQGLFHLTFEVDDRFATSPAIKEWISESSKVVSSILTYTSKAYHNKEIYEYKISSYKDEEVDYTISSDKGLSTQEGLKEDIVCISNLLSDIYELNECFFEWK